MARFEPQAVRPGPIYDLAGRPVGEHRGLARYTIGQRRRLGLRGDRPQYVVAIDPDRNALVVGDAASLRCAGLVVGDVNWIAIPGLREERLATVRIRHAAPDLPAVIAPGAAGRVVVRFLERPRAAAPGQAAAFYDGDVVLGGGVIEDVRLAAEGADAGHR